MKIIDFLFSIEHKMPLYIGNEDIMALKHFIDGYCVCAMINGIDYGEKEMRAFSDFVCDYLNESLAISAHECIKKHSTTNDDGLCQFYELLHQFSDSVL